MTPNKPDRLMTRLLVRLGLLYPVDGRPLGEKLPGRSRYGLHTSPRLDQDLDELRARVSRLERRD